MSLKEENARLRKEAGMWMQAALDLRKTAKQIADAAEFEARCLEYIATANSDDLPCNGRIEDCVFDEERCGWCGIKAARLAVEEEMDG